MGGKILSLVQGNSKILEFLDTLDDFAFNLDTYVPVLFPVWEFINHNFGFLLGYLQFIFLGPGDHKVSHFLEFLRTSCLELLLSIGNHVYTQRELLVQQ